MPHESEPSVEEILASIKQVIARDNRDAALARKERLGDRMDAAPEPVDADEAEDILDLSDAGEMVSREDDIPPEGGLIDEQVERGMRDSFAALSMLAEPGAKPQIVRSGETSLEGLVREMLRPMLAQWLDQNLPPMVERMVQAEIARIAGKRG